MWCSSLLPVFMVNMQLAQDTGIVRFRHFWIVLIVFPVHISAAPTVFLTQCPPSYRCSDRNFCDQNGRRTQYRNNNLSFGQDSRGLFACSGSADESLGVCCKEVFVGNRNENEMYLHDRKETYLESNVGGNGNVRENNFREKPIPREANINTLVNQNPVDDKKNTKSGNIRLVDILELVEKINDKQNEKITDRGTKLKKRKKKKNQIKIPLPEDDIGNIQLIDILSLEEERNMKQTKKTKLKKPENTRNVFKNPSEDMIPIFLNIKRNKFPGINPDYAAVRKLDKFRSSTNMKRDNIRIVDILDMVEEMNSKQSDELVTKREKNIRETQSEKNIPIFINISSKRKKLAKPQVLVEPVLTTTKASEEATGLDFSAEFVLKVLQLMNQDRKTVEKTCPVDSRCVRRSRCSFLGTIVDNPVQLSEEMEAMRVPLQRCQSRSRKIRDTVCCRDQAFFKQKENLEELFEEELDLNFDQIYIYANEKAPGGSIRITSKKEKPSPETFTTRRPKARLRKPVRRRTTGFTTRVTYKM